jgi:hypothetical protein
LSGLVLGACRDAGNDKKRRCVECQRGGFHYGLSSPHAHSVQSRPQHFYFRSPMCRGQVNPRITALLGTRSGLRRDVSMGQTRPFGGRLNVRFARKRTWLGD